MGGWLACDSIAAESEKEPEKSDDDDDDDEEEEEEDDSPKSEAVAELALLLPPPPPPKRDETPEVSERCSSCSWTRLCWSTGSMNLTTSFSISVEMMGRPSDSISSFCLVAHTHARTHAHR
jgi:hypothetical protein